VVRDFFKFLIGKAHSYVMIPGTYEFVWLGDEWLSRAQTAYDRAAKASALECQELHYFAGVEWQKIFGTDI
jgi:hypothetical protein